MWDKQDMASEKRIAREIASKMEMKEKRR